MKTFLAEWIELSNAFETEKYLYKYHKNAILDDPSVGRKYIGHEGIREYFETYFIGYDTQTTLVKLEIDDDQAHMEVEFTGNFPGKQIGGTFDFVFENGKIAKLKAALI